MWIRSPIRALPRGAFLLLSMVALQTWGMATAWGQTAPPAPRARKVVPAYLIKRDQLQADSPHLPPAVRRHYAGQVVTGSYKVCIAEDGHVQSVDTVSGIPDADEDIIRTLLRWQFKRQLIPICFIQFFEFHIEGFRSEPDPRAPFQGSVLPWLGTAGAAPAKLETAVPLIPAELSILVYSHTIYDPDKRPVSCISLVTRGFAGQRHKELLLTLVRAPVTLDRLAPLLRLFETVYREISKGRRIDAGNHAPLPSGVWGRYRGVVYVDASAIPGIPDVDTALAMLLLHPVEADSVRAFGINRFLTHLGTYYRYYPQPFWNDDARPPVLSSEDLDDSVLQQTRRIPLPGASVTRRDRVIQLRLSTGAHQRLLQALSQPSSLPPALLVDYDRTAGTRLLWHAGQSRAASFSAPL